ncbi:MAG TPA: tetratricopeptide repeat protein [Pseudolabrys sp.]|jgi:Flp pilus assembly protein TadD|nr:tetratricopeptide repeat protein [Pseudolabrys sp.]
MLTGIARGLVVTVAALWLAGCSTSNNFSNLFGSKTPSDEASAAQANAEASEPPTDETTTGTVPPPLGARPTAPGLLGSDPYDELSLGKKYYRSNNYGIAEKHFRRAVESHPRDAEAWLGLAASYDRLRRFDLADRAYGQAVGILGPTAEILNNQGYSYMLRGDYKRAHAALVAAQRKDPTNKFVQNNLRLLEESYRKGKAIE